LDSGKGCSASANVGLDVAHSRRKGRPSHYRPRLQYSKEYVDE
jgi:hypothetical protein